MNVLALDTSTKVLSLAVAKDGKILAQKNLNIDKVLSKSIIPAIDRILKSAKMPLARVDAFVVGLGPGSFTSLRVGLSTVKGLSMATQKPVMGISSLDALAESVSKDHRNICTIVDAKRNLVYAALYEVERGNLKLKTGYELVPLKDFLKKIKTDTIFIGDAVFLYKPEITSSLFAKASFALEKDFSPQAKFLVSLASKRLAAKQFDDITRLVPLYLYPEDCQVQRSAELNPSMKKLVNNL